MVSESVGSLVPESVGFMVPEFVKLDFGTDYHIESVPKWNPA